MLCDIERTELVDDPVTNAKKICLKMQSQDRKTRQQSYVDLKEYISSKDLDDQELRLLFCEIHVYILNGLRDKTELVREQAIKFIYYFIIERLPLNDFYLTYIFPVLVERIGSAELIEESEEIRLQLLQLLNAIISRYSNTEQLKPFLNDCIIILSESVKDKFPTIKELSCVTIILLSKALPQDFHMQAESLIKPVLSCFTYQRYKVRLESINAIGEIVMQSSYKGLDEVVGPLAEKLFDQIPTIRCAVARIAARWLLEYRDRYSYFHKILPLLLTGLNDEVEGTRIESASLWERVGAQYQQENEKDLKEEMDYLYAEPKYYPQGIKRPNLGCRVLVKRNVSKLSGAISRELMSWQDDVRVRCSQLLCVLALHAEEGITQNLQDLLPAMYTAARGSDSRVVINIIQACEIIGHFVKCDSWSKLVFPVIEDGPHFGHLTVLAGLIEGSPKEYISDNIETISKILADDAVCCNRKNKYQRELWKCVKALAEKYDDNVTTTGYNLFKIAVSLLALRHPDISEDSVLNLFEHIGNSLNKTASYEPWKLYMGPLLKHINVNPSIWTTVSDNACIFFTILLFSQDAFGENLEDIIVILNELFNGETDVELKLKTLHVLTNVFDDRDGYLCNAETNFISFYARIIKGILIPSLVWHAGATAEAIRTMAASCLYYVLGLIETKYADLLKEHINELWPLLISLLEDASSKSRKLAIMCLAALKETFGGSIWSTELLIKLYPEVLKRLDDPTEEVRECALRSIPLFINDSSEEFRGNHYKAHHELIIDTLLTHLDDEDQVVRDSITGDLVLFGRINKDLLLNKIEKHKPLLRNQEACNEILNSVNGYGI